MLRGVFEAVISCSPVLKCMIHIQYRLKMAEIDFMAMCSFTMALAYPQVIWEVCRPKQTGSFRKLWELVFRSPLSSVFFSCSRVVINRGGDNCTFVWNLQLHSHILGSNENSVSLFLIIFGVTSWAMQLEKAQQWRAWDPECNRLEFKSWHWYFMICMTQSNLFKFSSTQFSHT